MLLSRCSTFDVPGMGSITGDFLSSQASTSWLGVTLRLFAALQSGLSLLARLPLASGYHGMKPIFSRSQVLQHRFRMPIGQIIEILDGGNRSDPSSSFDLVDVNF